MAEREKKPRELAAEILPATFLSRDALTRQGLRSREITHSVASGELVRLRNGRYVPTGLPADMMRAGRLGARLDCVSLLSALGIFVHTKRGLHVQIERGSTRLPQPGHDVVRHWRCSHRERTSLCADVVDALAQSFRCQQLRHALATLESAWHHGIATDEMISQVFELLPRRYRRVRDLLDKRSESGAETLMRFMLRGLGCHVEVQVHIDGVGRVDFVVDGWLIIECDSRKYHEGWTNQLRDRRRDFAAATLGYTTIRPVAKDILYRPEHVVAMLKDVLTHPPLRPAVQNSATSNRSRRGTRQIRPVRANVAEF